MMRRTTKRFTLSPEVAYVPGLTTPLDHRHPSAVAFAIVGGTVATARQGVHHAIFSALKAVNAQMSASPIMRNIFESSGSEGIYREFGVDFAPRSPVAESLEAFAKIPSELNARRRATQAGRAWIGVTIEGRETTLISWWVKRAQVSSSTFSLLANTLGLSGKILLEFLDSQNSEAHFIKSKVRSARTK